MLGFCGPEVLDDERMVREMAQFELLAASPARVRSLFTHWSENDARADLERISVPTLVMHDRDNDIVPTALGQYLAEHIPGATFFEYPALSEIPVLESVLLQASTQCEFLTGSRVGVQADRILGVMLFLDVVESTERVLAHGDRGWRADVEALQRAARAEIGRVGARLVNTRGDDLFVLCPTPATAVGLAGELRARAAELGLAVRGGIHLAEVEDTGADVLGLGVHVAARVCDRAAAGEVWVTDPVRLALLGGSDGFEGRGDHDLKGIPGSWSLSAVADPEDSDRRVAP